MAEYSQELTVRRRVEAAPAEVWAVVTDLDHAVEHLSQVTGLRRLTDGPYAIGTGWRETRRMMGRTETQELWVVANDPGRSTVTEATHGGARYRTEITLEPLDGDAATQLSVRFSGRGPEPIGLGRVALKVIGPLALRMTERTLRIELDDIARAAEARTSQV